MIARFDFRKDIGDLEIEETSVSTQPSSYRRRGDWVEICTLTTVANAGKEVKKYAIDLSKISGKVRIEELVHCKDLPVDEEHEKELQEEVRKELKRG